MNEIVHRLTPGPNAGNARTSSGAANRAGPRNKKGERVRFAFFELKSWRSGRESKSPFGAGSAPDLRKTPRPCHYLRYQIFVGPLLEETGTFLPQFGWWARSPFMVSTHESTISTGHRLSLPNLWGLGNLPAEIHSYKVVLQPGKILCGTKSLVLYHC